MRRSLATAVAVAALATSLFGGSAYAGTVVKPAFPAIVGNGSSFQGNFQAACISKFNGKKPTGYSSNGNVSYTVSSSGDGMAAFHTLTGGVPAAAFAGTDGPDTTKTAADGGSLVVVPVTAAAVAFVYNVTSNGSQVPGIKLTPAILDGIYHGTITSWDDNAIQLANGAKWKAATRTTPAGWTGGLSAKLPTEQIKVNVRTDGSGTTKNLNLYMAANTSASSNWNTSGSKNWGTGSGKVITSGTIADYTARSNSDAMITAVKQTEGAIGYADAPDATTAVNAKLASFARLQNKAGEFQLPTAGAAQKLIDSAKTVSSLTTNGFLSSSESISLFSSNVSGAYQLTVITYVQASGKNTAANNAVFSYINYALNSCQGSANFTRLTPDLLNIAKAQAAKIGADS